MEDLFIKLLNISTTAIWLIFAVIVLRLVLKKAPKFINLILWAFVGVRLICPVSFESVLSIIPTAEPIPDNIQYASEPTIDTGIDTVDRIINPVISDLAPNVSASVNPIQIILTIAFGVWIAGVVAMLIYSMTSYILIYKKVKVSARYEDNIYLCDNIKSPFILGTLKPKIYLPSDISKQQMQSVIFHEKAHIKRLDHIWKPLGFAILSIHWFNPIVWLAYTLFCRDIEFACDEKVIKNMRAEDKKAYSESLLSLSLPNRSLTACPLAFGEVGVKSRIKSVLNYKKPAIWIIIVAVVTLAAVAIGFMTNPANSQINGKIFAPVRYYHQEVIGADRANEEQMDFRYYISEDYVLSMYIEDGLNYSINHQGNLIKQEHYDENRITLVLDKLPSYYRNMNIDEVYEAESSFDLTEPKTLYTLIKFSNGALIFAYMPTQGDGNYYAHEVLQVKATDKEADLPIDVQLSGTAGATDCEGVTVKVLSADYTSENAYIGVELKNNTESTLTYGSDYHIYRYENGEKVDCDILENRVWTAILYFLLSDSTETRKFSLKGYDLSKPGLYSLEFDFELENEEDSQYTAVIEFEIADTLSVQEPVVSTSDPSIQPQTQTNTPISDTFEDLNPSFDAKVLEVNENNILVEPLEGEAERSSASKIYVSTNVISEIAVTEIKKGDKVRIVYNGEIQETYPAQSSQVYVICLAEDDA